MLTSSPTTQPQVSAAFTTCGTTIGSVAMVCFAQGAQSKEILRAVTVGVHLSFCAL